jgi:pantoate--beta-alanine ligase
VAEVRAALASAGTVGFVPTMGAFHEGHLELMRRARHECDTVVVSLYVNPLQFGPNEDLAAYPRDEEADFSMARGVGVDVMFCPSVDEMTSDMLTTVHVRGVSEEWEGRFRSGHFDGVATIVATLFNIVRPDVAYFGKKDLQQCAVVRRMIDDLAVPVRLEVSATVREPDGMAMSSRNRYFSPTDRAEAANLARECSIALREVLKGADLAASLRSAEVALSSHGFAVQYLAYVHERTLEPLARTSESGRIIVAAKFGGVRLIDNFGPEDASFVLGSLV